MANRPEQPDRHRWRPSGPGLILFLALLLLAGSCARRPVVPLTPTSYPVFTDDLDYDGLQQAIDASLRYLRTLPRHALLPAGDTRVPVVRLRASLYAFAALVAARPSPGTLNREIRRRFQVLQATGGHAFDPERAMLVTGYFQPVFPGSVTRKPPYLYPLYTVPGNLAVRRTGSSGSKAIGRLQNGTFLPYWTRAEIEQQGRARGYELVWLRDPMDAFVLHVQGSGLIRLTDGTLRGVHYALKNGRPYRSIGRYLVQSGRISLADASLKSIRAYIASHPDERDEILYHNQSFIFFNWSPGQGAVGNLGVRLTPGRSIAVDQSCFPAGALAFLSTRQPVMDRRGRVTSWKPLQRFVLVQDRGSAIRGPGRVDLFWGTGARAGAAAGRMKEDGALYFLLLRQDHAR
ncbi:murein transglycosylase A [Thermodesulfobacteriota bacterium B35]